MAWCLLCILQDQIDVVVSTGAYTGPVWSSIYSLQVHPVVLNSPTHDLTNPFPFTFGDSEASDVFPYLDHS